MKSRVRNWKLGSQKDERRSFSPATVVRRTSKLERAQEFRHHIQQLVHHALSDDADDVFVAVHVYSLDSQLLAVTEGKAIISERTQHDCGVHHILFKAQEAHVQSLKPHEHSVLCNTSKNKGDQNQPGMLVWSLRGQDS